FLIGSLPGSIIGSWVNNQINTHAFSLYFGILMIIIFLMMMVDRKKLVKDKQIDITNRTRTFEIDGETYQYNVNYTPAFILSFLVGALSGLFGIGGGTISVPAMILFFGIPVQVAIGTSMFMIFFISLISSSTHIFLGHIAWKYVIFFIIGSYLGGTAGARMSKWFKGNTLEWILRIVILIAAIRLIYESLDSTYGYYKMQDNIHLYYTNDLHSHFEKWPKITAFLNKKKQEAARYEAYTLTVDIGDHMDRVNPISEATLGKANVTLLNEAEYDIVTLGNNEGITLGHDELYHLYDDASFDVVCANLKHTYGDRPPWLKNYQIRTTPNGTRIGLFGLTARFNPYYHLLGWDAKEIEKVVAD